MLYYNPDAVGLMHMKSAAVAKLLISLQKQRAMCVDSKNRVVARQTDPKEQSHETKCDITAVMCGGADLLVLEWWIGSQSSVSKVAQFPSPLWETQHLNGEP